MPTLDHYQKLLPEIASKDRFRLQRKCHELKKQKTPTSEEVEKLGQQIQASYDWVQARQQAIPEIEFPQNLPVVERLEEIQKTIQENQVVILAGETGSGKTTQLPKICLSLGRGCRGLIGHTQPRRIAARSVSNRIAEELKVPMGGLVGYQVRFTDQASDETAIKLMTDGILLAEIQQDRFLNRYDTLIIDEAHERSLNIDFLLGYLKQLLPKRPDLKLIITSATIDVDKFSQHFNDAPVLEVSGRTFPVDVLYRPLLDQGEESGTIDINRGIIDAIDEINSLGPDGDVLVFLSGEREIREAALAIKKANIPHISVLPLYARLSVAEQNKVFQAHRGRRIVLSTNVAETALTVPGIRYVIDTGLARVSRYSYRTKVQRLPIEPISQASANQRKGRCGRVSEGVCIRLYSEDDFNQRPEYTEAEILRTNLAAVILQMEQLRLGDLREFPFVDTPDHRLINDGYQLLQELQAIGAESKNKKGKLTAIGRQLATLPIDPRLGRMLIAAREHGCVDEVAAIASLLSVQDPRERPANKQQAADQAHRQWWDEQSDFIGFVNLWREYENQRQELSNNQLQKWCKKNYLAYMRMREWRDIHTQLLITAKRLGIKPSQTPANQQQVHTALLSGLLAFIGVKSEEKGVVGEYLGARNRRFSLFPGSSQFKKKPNWIVAAQLLETSKLYAHHIAKVEPKWILHNARHLVKRQYSEPHYVAKSGQVMAFEKITLYGVTLIEKQRVAYGSIDPKVSREVFIRSALVEERYGEHGQYQRWFSNGKNLDKHFFYHQSQLLKELKELEAKSRRQDIVVDEQVLFEFYNERVPENIVNFQGFEHWRKETEKAQPRLLFIEREQLMQHDANHITEAQFPNQLTVSGLTLPLSYHFEPSHKDDGVSLHVPVAALHLIEEASLEWLVPGLLKEKCVALVKALPKQWRKHFVPVPAAIDKILPKITGLKMTERNRPLKAVLAEQLFKQTGVQVPEAAWEDIKLDPFYSINIRVIDESNRTLESGRDLSLLKEHYRDQVQQQIKTVGNGFERDNITAWDFGELPEHYDFDQQQMTSRAYPGLYDESDSVALRLYDNAEEAKADSIRGSVRLAYLSQKQTVKYLQKQLLKDKGLGLAVVDMGSREQLLDDIICAAIKQVCFDKLPELPIRQQEAFNAAVDSGRALIVERAETLANLIEKALLQVVQIKKQIKQSKNALLIATAVGDIQQQLQHLFYPGVMYDTPYEWLQQYDRYLKAILLRLEKVAGQINKDRSAADDMEGLWSKLDDVLQSQGTRCYQLNPDLQQYRWMLEELRVSLFAQNLGTKIPVSVKRLNKQWELC